MISLIFFELTGDRISIYSLIDSFIHYIFNSYCTQSIMPRDCDYKGDK